MKRVKTKQLKRKRRVRKVRTVEKPKRKRVKKVLYICDCNRCWYNGPCPHKTPHAYSKKCETDFCSYMGIKTECKKVRKNND